MRVLASLHLAILAAVAPLAAQRATADLVLLHGTILTVDSSDHVARAVAITDNRIVAVGSDHQIHRG